jgi:hypothetical protein
LRSRAESYHPFGIKPYPLQEQKFLSAFHKIDSTSLRTARFEDEDDDEYEDEPLRFTDR